MREHGGVVVLVVVVVVVGGGGGGDDCRDVTHSTSSIDILDHPSDHDEVINNG